ncbi:hypothetical protein NSA16_00300 [Ligilactobacillus murinus]|nr:hypothetical protein [Ligilactobacillus murinus]
MKKFAKDNWDKILSLSVSIISILLSIGTFINQQNIKNQYNDTSNQVILNSINLARYDLKLMKLKINMSQNGNQITYQQLAFQIDSLKKNMETIKQVQVTELPRDKTLNYQVYTQDLNAIIYQCNNDLNSLKKLANKSENGEDLLELNPINIKTLLSAIDKDLQILSDDEQVIEENGNLYDRHYKQALKEIESLN